MKHARIAWGCDAPAAGPVFEVTCSACSGAGYAEGSDGACAACNGSGLFKFDRCPSAALGETPLWERASLDHLLRSYLQFDSRHVMPEVGGYSDQSAYWCTAVDLIDSERGRLDALLEDKQERERKAAESRAKKGQTHSPRRR